MRLQRVGYNLATEQQQQQMQLSFISKAPACNAGDPGSIPGSGRSPGDGNGNPLQYSCLENPMDRGAWRATVHRVVHKESERTEAS